MLLKATFNIFKVLAIKDRFASESALCEYTKTIDTSPN